ncbi:uridine-cytidine kinase-like 1 [Exaiptasia diaphana]|uniref:Uridine kinase n=1 Tax=Exaiptasia diaphana TaxID=2652724 RepID=A0A913Y4P4_EXADI|nr:uridine-cytidine kinase-like 1 [Exaiptasia diaphana]KXJ28933.1 Uridine-cytidine kinase-like 1 [Exaiptasia diaphana]
MAGKGIESLPLDIENRSNSPNGDSSGSTGSIEEETPLPPPSPMKPKSSNVMVFTRSNKTVYTAGRPPWYNSQGQLKEAFVIGLCGGSASGKTTVATKIIEALDVPWVSMLSLDSFYKVLTKEQHELANKNEYNFDHPDAFDAALCAKILKRLKKGKSVQIPVYDFKTHSRTAERKDVYGANVIIFEGIMAFAYKDLRDLMDMKVFVDTDPDIRLARRLKRDITERNRELSGVLQQYSKFVKPAFDQHIAPTVNYADIVVPRGGENDVAIDLIVRHVKTQLEQRGFNFRSRLVSAHHGQPLPSSLNLVENTPQVKGIHTIIRDHKTSRDDFIFYSKRLMRILIEHALSLLPFKSLTVTTQGGNSYNGEKFAGKRLCGVSILRAGETLEPALESVCKEIRIGKILIQTNYETDEPELHYLRLPQDISEDHVILMDATIATGAAALMAIRVLLDHEVKEENILFVSLIAAESGVHTIAYAYPKVKIITTAVDPEVNSNYHIIPGIGNFGDRYFGTEY